MKVACKVPFNLKAVAELECTGPARRAGPGFSNSATKDVWVCDIREAFRVPFNLKDVLKL